MLTHESNSELMDAIYEAALDPEHWIEVLERLSHAFGGSSAHLSVENYAMTEGRLVSFGTDRGYEKSYADYYITRNVLWERLTQKPDTDVTTSRSLMPWEELQRSEFYNDFLRPQDGEEILVSVALRQRDRASCLTIWRPERLGPWGSREMKALTEITPHFRRALRANASLGDMRLARDVADEALNRLDHGVLFVDAAAHSLFANRAAEAMLTEGSGLYLERRHRLAAREAGATSALRRLLADTAKSGTGGSLVLARDMRPSLIVIVLPMKREFSALVRARAGVVVLIKDLERPARFSLATFARHFELTPAQCALAQEMVRGDGVHAAATRLGVSYATARTHLLHIFQKTGTARQAELVRLMLEWNEGPIVGDRPRRQ